MNFNLTFFNNIISILGVLGQLLLLGLIIILIFKKESKIFIFLKENSFLLAFIIAFTATLGSIFYFEIFKVEPCLLCWYQRILMYPQALILGLALYKNDKNIKNYIIFLSIIGLGIALYHNLIQINSNLNTICSINSNLSFGDCSSKYIIGLNYITIPFMSLLSFSLILVLMLFNKNKNIE
ncbi:MAG: disulfide bond formation protein B [Minisyncoccia bacterium]